MRVIYHPHAEAELIHAAQHFERQVSELGVRFLDEAESGSFDNPENSEAMACFRRRHTALPYAALSIRNLLSSVW